MGKRFVYGTYLNANEADQAVNELINRGVDPSAIHLAANPNVLEGLDTNINVLSSNELENPEDNRSWFDKIFGIDEPLNEQDIDYSAYQTSFDNNEILVLVDEHYEAEAYRSDLAGNNIGDPAAINTYQEINTNNDNVEAFSNKNVDSETIRLHEEQVHARAVEKDTGEVKITKEVVEDTKTVEVPVRREEVHITRTDRPLDGHIDDKEAFTEETIVVPVSEEEVEIDKDVVVTDEIQVDRVEKTDYETVTEQTRREELNVDDDVEYDHVDKDLNEDKF